MSLMMKAGKSWREFIEVVAKGRKRFRGLPRVSVFRRRGSSGAYVKRYHENRFGHGRVGGLRRYPRRDDDKSGRNDNRNHCGRLSIYTLVYRLKGGCFIG